MPLHYPYPYPHPLQSISQWLMASITEYEALINPLRLLGIPSPRPGKTSPATRAASPIYKTAPAGLPARIAAEVVLLSHEF